jgi:hypothetical protein
MAIAQTFDLIQNQTLGSNSYQVSFTSIAQTYTDLFVTTDGQYTTNVGYAGHIGFNNEGVGNNVTGLRMVNGGSIALQDTGSDISFAPANQTYGSGAMHKINIFNYTSTSMRKPFFLIHNTGSDTTTGAVASVSFAAGSYSVSGTAITRLDFYAATGGFFQAGSKFALWGIRTA